MKQIVAIGVLVLGSYVILNNILMTLDWLMVGGEEYGYMLVGRHLWTVVSGIAIYKVYPVAFNKKP